MKEPRSVPDFPERGNHTGDLIKLPSGQVYKWTEFKRWQSSAPPSQKSRKEPKMENEQLTYGNLHWFEYRQNNSGGVFVMDDDASLYVFIQAESADAANQKAEEVTIYFDGCESDRDCDCCGDRWYRADYPEDSFTTHLFWRGENAEYDNISDYAQALANDSMWVEDDKPAVIVYFADGSVKRFYKTKG